jgi:hypothetical protein
MSCIDSPKTIGIALEGEHAIGRSVKVSPARQMFRKGRKGPETHPAMKSALLRLTPNHLHSSEVVGRARVRV